MNRYYLFGAARSVVTGKFSNLWSSVGRRHRQSPSKAIANITAIYQSAAEFVQSSNGEPHGRRDAGHSAANLTSVQALSKFSAIHESMTQPQVKLLIDPEHASEHQRKRACWILNRALVVLQTHTAGYASKEEQAALLSGPAVKLRTAPRPVDIIQCPQTLIGCNFKFVVLVIVCTAVSAGLPSHVNR